MYEYIDALKKCFVINGRTSRRGYWMFILFNALFGVLFFVALIILFKIIAIFSLGLGIIILLIPWFLYCSFIAIPSFTITIRRLHDINKSGWWLLISLIPVISGWWLLISLIPVISGWWPFISLISVIGDFWLLFLLLTKGNKGKNEYGEVPVEIIGTPIQWRKIITIMIFALFGIAVVLFFVYMINDSIKSDKQKKLNEANKIINEERIENVKLPSSFIIKTTYNSSNTSADIESKKSLTFINNVVTKGESSYKVQEGAHCKENCYHENNCVVDNDKWVGVNSPNVDCSRLPIPTIKSIKEEILYEYYVPLDRCTLGLTCYEITEIK